jgi:prolyl-tRNA synthetase
MRASQLFIPTLREDPGDAEAVSHKLLVRGGFIRQVSAGLWSFAPLGWRVHRKIEQIIREEMDAIGGQEMLMPVLTPAELWEATGRIAIPEIFRVRDRTGRDFIRSRSTRARSRATAICRSSGTTSRRRTGTNRDRAAAFCGSASSS